MPPENRELSPEAVERHRQQIARINCGFEKVKNLPGNAGYLKFKMLGPKETSGSTGPASVNPLANCGKQTMLGIST